MNSILAYVCIVILLKAIVIENRSLSDLTHNKNVPITRARRYLGLGKQFKLNKKYGECIAPGDLPGHCKHAIYCPMDVRKTTRDKLEFYCVIEDTHIGICCPDDVALSNVQGARLVQDLPASGSEYDTSNNTTGCGLNTMADSESASRPGQRWPWIAALYLKEVSYEQFCGGTLITDQHVLTASHCLEGLDMKDIRVRLGEYDFIQLHETRSKDFSLIEMTMHEEYSTLTYDNDIAVVRLDHPANFNDYIWPICLPPVQEDFEGETAIVGGWGQIYYGGPTSELLLEVSVPVWKQEDCVAAFAQTITENVLCAGAYEGGKDACKGDSGGPLLYQMENKRWSLIGVVSWGIGCGNKGKPGIYTRVNKYIPWIIKKTTPK